MPISLDNTVTIEMTTELHPSVFRAQEAARRRAEEKKATMRVNAIRFKTEEAAKKAFILDRIIEDRLIRIFLKAGLLRQPANTDTAGWDTYIERLEKLNASSGGKELIEKLRCGWEPAMIFSATRGSIMIAFRIPDQPNILCYKNFNIEEEDDRTVQERVEELRMAKMNVLREKLETFRQTLEGMLSLSIPSDFMDAYITFREAIAPQNGNAMDSFEMLPANIRRYADDFSGAILNSLSSEMALSQELPNAENITSLYRQEIEIFNHDVLHLRSLPEQLMSYGNYGLDLSPGDLEHFRTATMPLHDR